MLQQERLQSQRDNFMQQKDFQNINKDLTLVKAVLYHKALKHDLHKWSMVVALINKLILIMSSFFLFSGVFQVIIRGPPAIAGICSIPLTRKELGIDVNSKPLAILVYIIQITNSLYGLVIAVIGILQRRRLNLDVAKWNIKHLTVAPFLLAGLMIADGVANFFYM